MTTQTQTQTVAKSGSTLVAAVLAFFVGGAAIVVTGHVQADTLHDAAHDVRHATGFPCH